MLSSGVKDLSSVIKENESKSALTTQQSQSVVLEGKIFELREIKISDDKTEIKAPIPSQQDIFHSKYFDESDLEQLKNSYPDKNLKDLEDIINNHPVALMVFKAKQGATLIIGGIGFNLFINLTSKSGLEKVYKLMVSNGTPAPQWYPNLIIPSFISIGVMSAISFSIPKKAAEETLNYALRTPFLEQIKENIQQIAHPSPAIAGLYLWGKKIGINTIGTAMTCIQFAYASDPYLVTLNPVTKNIIRAPIFYFGFNYVSNFFTPGYYKGLQFWENEKNDNPWLIHLLKTNKKAMIIQTWFQGLSSVALRVYPTFYFFLMYMAEQLELSATKTNIVLTIGLSIAAFYNAVLLYPATYLNYWSAHNRIEQISLTDKIEEKTAENNPSKIVAEYAEGEKSTLNFTGHTQLMTQDKLIFFLFLCQASLGGVMGYQISKLVNSLPATILLSMTGTGLFGGLRLFAENTRLRDGLVLQQLEAKKNKDKKPEEKVAPMQRKSKCIQVTGYAVKILNGFNGVPTNYSIDNRGVSFK